MKVRLTEDTRSERAFKGAVNRNIRSMDRLDAEAVKKVTALLKDARSKISARIADASGFEAFILPQLKGEVERIMGEFQMTYLDEFDKLQIRAEDLGTAIVKEPLARVGIQISFPVLPTELTQTLASFHADQIRGVTAEAVQKITTELSVGLLGGSSKDEVLKNIARHLPSPAGAGTVTKRATRIVRTEVNRIHSITTQRRLEQAKEQVSNLGKYWLPAFRNTRPTHLAAGAQFGPDRPIGVDEYFIVGGHRAKHPRDPALPVEEVVNCQCFAVPVIMEAA